MLITNFHVSASHPLIRLLVCAVTAAVVLFAGYAMSELLSEKAEELQVTEIIFLGDIKNEKNKN